MIMNTSQRFAKRLTLLPLLTLVVALLSASTASAATSIRSAGSGNWNSLGTWSPAQVPGAGDIVTIRAGDTVTVTAAAAAATVSFATNSASTATLTVNSGFTLTLSGGITLSNSVSIATAATLAGAGTITCASVTVGGQNTPSGGTDTATLTSTISTLTISGNLTLTSMASGANYNNAYFNLNSGSVSVGGTVALTAPTGATVELAMDNTPASGTLTLSGSTPFTTSGSGTINFVHGTSDNVIYSGAAQTVRAATYRNLILSGSGIKTIPAGVTINGLVSIQGAATLTGTAITYSTAILEYKGSAAQTASLVEFPATLSSADVLIDNPSGVTLPAGKTLSGNLYLTNGVLAASTYLTMGAYTIYRSGGSVTGTIQGNNAYSVTYLGASKTTGPELSGTGLATVTVNLTAGQTLTLDQNRAPDTDLTIASGIFDIGGNTINNGDGSGTLTVSSGATLRIGVTGTLPSNYSTRTPAATSTIEFYGGDQAVPQITGTYGNLIISGTGTKTLSGAETVTTSLTLASSTFATAGLLTLGSGATIVRDAGTLTANANWPTFTTTVNVLYTNATAVTTGPEIPAGNTLLGNLTIAKSGGVTLGANAVVKSSGNLTLITGILTTTDSYSVSVTNTASTAVTAAAGWVNGTLRKTFATGNNQSFTFPIGDASVSAPVQFQRLTNNTATSDLSVKTTAGEYSLITASGLTQNKDVNRYWTLAKTGIGTITGSSPTFNFVAGDVDPGAATGSFIVRRYSGGSWFSPNLGPRTATSTTISNVIDTTMGDFVIGELNVAPVPTNPSLTRAPGASLKIPISTLFTTPDANGDPVALTGVTTPTGQGAAVSQNGTYVFYTPVNNNNDTIAYSISDGTGGTANGTITITVAAAGGTAQTITVSGAGTANIKFFGIPGIQYNLQRATSVGGPWTTIAGPTTAGSDGSFSFSDTPGNGTWFYRSIQN
jgi:hypothetical protein